MVTFPRPAGRTPSRLAIRACGAQIRLVIGATVLTLSVFGLTDESASAEEAAAAAEAGAAADYPWDLPPGFEPPAVPLNNPMTPEKVALGQSLFSDARLSADGTYSCASCHQPARAFTDGLAVAVGVFGGKHPRNTPTLINSAYNASFGWLNEGIETLEAQHQVPLTNQSPVEMGFNSTALAELNRDLSNNKLALSAFGTRALNDAHVVQALASFVRTLIQANAPFDRYLYFDEPTLSPEALEGLALFQSPNLACTACHVSQTFSGPIKTASDPDVEPVFHVTGVSGSSLAFRAPTLRNLAQTAPYMHDGSLETLAEVIDFYAAGGGAVAGKREVLRGFEIDADAKRALIAFLHSL